MKQNISTLFPNCDPKMHNLTEICEVKRKRGRTKGCKYFKRCKRVTRKKYEKLLKKMSRRR